MAPPLNQMPLPGSALPTPSAPCLGHLPPLEQIDVVVRLRQPPRAVDVAAVVRFAVDSGLRVLDVDPRAAVVDLRGSVLALSRSFGVHLRAYAGPEGRFHGRRGVILVPLSLAGAVVAVDGLDERPADPGRRAPASVLPVSSPVSAAPRNRAGRARPEPAGEAGPPAPTSVAGGRDGVATDSGLAVVLRPRFGSSSAPLERGRSAHPSLGLRAAGPVPLAPARTRRRGPLARAAADQGERRRARGPHPAGVDRS
jgi:hypothetical protein